MLVKEMQCNIKFGKQNKYLHKYYISKILNLIFFKCLKIPATVQNLWKNAKNNEIAGAQWFIMIIYFLT